MSTTPTQGNYCPRHNVDYGRLEQCSACEGDPGEIEMNPDDVLATDPVARADELWFRANAEKLVELADRLVDERAQREAVDRIGYSTVAKIYEVALKFKNAAVEERRQRTDIEHDRWLIRQKRELAGVDH